MLKHFPRVIAAVWVLALLASAGCGAKWEAMPVESQLVFVKGQGLEQQTDELSLRVMPVELPSDEQNALVALAVEVANDRTQPFVIGPWRFRLQYADGHLRRPLSSAELRERFGLDLIDEVKDAGNAQSAAPAEAGGSVELALYRDNRPGNWRFRRYRSRFYPYPYGYRNIYWYYPYYYPYDYYWSRPSPYGSDAGYEFLQEQRDLARLVSEVWEDTTIAPNEVVSGIVVFDVPTEKHADVKLLFDATARSAAVRDAAFPENTWSFQFVRTQ